MTATAPVQPQINLVPFIEDLCIVDKDGLLVRLGDIMHPAQRKLIEEVNRCLNERRPIRIVVLKARQIGISTIIEAILFTFAMLQERMKGLVISHELDSSEHILQMCQTYYDNFQFKEAYKQKNKSAKTLAWLGVNSDIRITTAGNQKAGRSRTIRFLHASEVAFWDNAKTLMTGLAQTIPERHGTAIFLESTANGIGNYFHSQWLEACKEQTNFNYIPLFFPWWTHPEYTGTFIDLPAITGGLDEYERALVKLLSNPPKQKWNDYTAVSMTYLEIIDRLTWRRYAISNLCQGDLLKFQQEYPATPDEAFIATGKNVLPLDALNDCFQYRDGYRGNIVKEGEKVRFQADPIEGRFTLFAKPDPMQSYIVAGDPTHTMDGDYAVAQVINRRTWEQVGVYRAKVDGRTFGEKTMELGRYYNDALWVCENAGGGSASIAVALDRGYPNIWQHQKAEKMPGQIDNWYGWQTNSKTKPEAIANLRKVLVDRNVLFHDQTTYDEAKNFVSLGNGKFGNSSEEDHDDTVMSWAIGMTVILYEAIELVQMPVEQEYRPPPVKLGTVGGPQTVEAMTGGKGMEMVLGRGAEQERMDAGMDEQRAPWEDWGNE